MEKKSFIITEALALLLGWLGVHRYYTGYVGLGIIQTLTLGGLGIWAFIDFLFISLGKYKDANGQDLEDYDKNIGMGAIFFVVVISFITASF
jgi:TM2 domain-containing membrane protein YozV